MNFIEACRKFISIESTPTTGSLDAARWLAEYARAKGLFVEVQEEYAGDRLEANVIIRPQAERFEKELLLQAHLDTPEPGPFQLWTKNSQNPFDATIEDGFIYGLGVSEAKIDLICKIEALVKIKELDQKYKLPPVIAATFGEETGMNGALKLIRKNKVSATMALIGEPTSLQICTAAKGFASVEIRIPFSDFELEYKQQHNLKESTSTQSKFFTGKAAHSSMPHLGESAIRKMFDQVLMLPDSIYIMEADGGTNFNTVPSHAFLELDFGESSEDTMAKRLAHIYRMVRKLETEFIRYQDPQFNPGYATLNIGLVRTFEDHILIAGNCRIPPVVPQEVYESWMNALKEACDEVSAVFRIVDYKKPFRTSEASILVRACRDTLKSMDLDDALMTQSSTNEASIFSRTGIDCLSFGPGVRAENTHTPFERVSLAEVKKAEDFYFRIMQRICL